MKRKRGNATGRASIILSDTLLVAIAKAQLMAARRWPRCRFSTSHCHNGDGCAVAAVACGLALPEEACPQPTGFRLDEKRALKAPSDHLLTRIRTACDAHGIDPELVASRADVESYLRAQQKGRGAEHLLGQGWRAQLLA